MDPHRSPLWFDMRLMDVKMANAFFNFDTPRYREPLFYQLSVRYHLLFGKPTSKYRGTPSNPDAPHASLFECYDFEDEIEDRLNHLESSFDRIFLFFFFFFFFFWRIIYFLLLHRNAGSIFNFPRNDYIKILIPTIIFQILIKFHGKKNQSTLHNYEIT